MSEAIKVVATFGSPYRLNKSSAVARMRSAVRRGGFFTASAFAAGFQHFHFSFQCIHTRLQIGHVLDIWQTHAVQSFGHHLNRL